MSSPYILFLVTLATLALFRSRSVSAAATPAQAEYAILSAKANLFFTYDEIHVQEINTAKNPILNNKYRQCGGLYTSAVNDLQSSLNYLKSGDYRKVVALAAAALEDVRSCDRIFTPAGTESRFKSLSEKAVSIGTDLLAFVKGLA